ncbi:hypothetical protein ACIA6D_41670 [Streptomyces cacaoi]
MDAADLDYRTRTLTGCIPPLLVARLLELGHEREVEFQVGRGEWFCALEWARLPGIGASASRRDHDTATLRNDHGRFIDDQSWGQRRGGHH